MKLVLNGINRNIGARAYIIFAAGLIIAVALSCTAASASKTIALNINGEQKIVTTNRTTVGELFEDMGIMVAKEDYVNQTADTKLYQAKNIEYSKASKVNLTVDGKSVAFYTIKKTVGEALAERSIEVAGTDKLIGAAVTDKIADGMTFKITRVKEVVKDSEEPIPYSIIRKDNNFLAYGNEKVITAGAEGTKNIKYSVKYEDGVEVSRTFISENVIKAPVNAVIERGTILSYNASRGAAFNFTNSYDMLATAYNCPDNIGTTYSGQAVRKGIIAVDPKIIPLGSLVYVEVPGGVDYGYAIASDIGGAINGNRIDVYLESYGEAVTWGLTNVKVYILQ